MSVRHRSVASLAAFAALVAGCFSAGPPAGGGGSSSLGGTKWVLESGTSIPSISRPAPAAVSPAADSAQPTVTQAAAPAPSQAAWLLPDRGSRPTLIFSLDRNRASGATGCNRYFGDVSAGTSNLSFSGVATTQMMCFDGLAVQESAYLDILSRVTSYVNSGTRLTLTTSDGRHLVFAPLSSTVEGQAASHRYVCDDGLSFTASFDPGTQSAAIEVSTGATDVLKQQATGAATTYASAHHRLHAKGSEALLDTLYDGVSHRCVTPLSPRG